MIPIAIIMDSAKMESVIVDQVIVVFFAMLKNAKINAVDMVHVKIDNVNVRKASMATNVNLDSFCMED